MALVSKMVSDISGEEAPETDFITLVVREHPAIDEPRALDVLPKELEKLKSAGDVVVLEVKNGETKQVIVTLAEFRKLLKDDAVQTARKTRGRRPGFSPTTSAASAPQQETA